ncbi:DUF3575 domain-containing protein [Parabacteroides sp. OttesenSCG-928-G06]|nr:DUF3575 domain-containing protein [Parabacteroides sp. OttesenSCG-928-K15]MDL2281743.1 DUF3575 domain-containing protein [Parabacteroides sp. OttesenSCG-928-G06]
MKKIILVCSLLLALTANTYAQDKIALKTNTLGWAAYGTANIGVEFGLSDHWTLDIDLYANPWKFGDHKQLMAFGGQPEARYWLGDRFKGHFFGAHGLFLLHDGGLEKYRYDGWTAAAGLSYGYSLALGNRWRIEANVGAGYIHADYRKSGRVQYPDDVRIYDPETKDMFGLTRAGLSVIFLIK